MPEFSEDMGRKARWFYELNGSTDRAFLDDLRDKAIAHVERMREARISRLDPGGGSIADPFVLVGAGGATLSRTTTPGQAGGVFVTAAIQVDADDEFLDGTLKVKLRRGTSGFDLATTRLFRYDPERETWVRIDASGWNANDKYVWGRVDRPAVYAAVALPKDPEALRLVAFETFARRTIRDGVASGQFGSAADFADRSALRNYLVDAGHVDVDRAGDRKHLDAILKVHRRFVRDLGADLGRESIGGNPQWSLLSHLLAFRGQFLTHLDLDVVLPFWPIIARVANRVGPWFHLGPNNINGRVKSIALHPGNSDVIWAGAANGGVWKSTNGGDSWSTKWKFEDSLAIGAVAAAPSNGDVVYAGTGEDTPGWGPNFGGAGLYKSRNGGGTWERIASTSDVGSYCNKIVVHPTNSRKVYVAADSGVYRADIGLATTIGGDPVITWKKVLTGRATDLVMQHDHPNVLLAGIHNKGVYKTVDGGDHWTRIEGLKVTVFAIIFAFKENFPVDGDAGWIRLAMGRSGEHGSNQVVVKLGKDSATTLLSADAGETWLKTPGSVGVDYDEWCSLAALHPRQPLHIYLASVNMKHSTDGWNYLDSPGTHSDHHQMVFHRSNDNVAFVCCDGGVYRTTDNGSSWHLRSDLLSATQLMSLGVSAAGDFVAGSATQDQGIIQTNGSTNWVDHGGGNEWGMFVVDPNDSRNIFISPGGGQIRRSTDRGVSYTAPTSGLTDWWPAQNRNTIAASFAHAAVKPGNSDIVVGPATVTEDIKDANGNVTATYPAKHRIYYSTNGGVDWSSAFTLPHRGSRIAFAPSNHSRVYVATSQGRVYRSDSSGTGGWSEPASAADRPPGQNITSIAVDPANSSRVYITYGGSGMAHIYRSTNAGATWSPCDGSGAMQLPDIALLDVVIDSENSDVLYAASAIGVFRSNDRGSTWYWANDGLDEHDLPRVMVTGLAIQPGTHRLYASTMGRGLYYTQATGIVSMRATHVKLAHEWPEPSGILKLKLTDGSNTYVMTRLEVIRRIQAGTEVYTLGPGGTRTRVRVLQPDAVHPLEYLSTSPDGTTTNNLLSLPRFYG